MRGGPCRSQPAMRCRAHPDHRGTFQDRLCRASRGQPRPAHVRQGCPSDRCAGFPLGNRRRECPCCESVRALPGDTSRLIHTNRRLRLSSLRRRSRASSSGNAPVSSSTASSMSIILAGSAYSEDTGMSVGQHIAGRSVMSGRGMRTFASNCADLAAPPAFNQRQPASLAHQHCKAQREACNHQPQPLLAAQHRVACMTVSNSGLVVLIASSATGRPWDPRWPVFCLAHAQAQAGREPASPFCPTRSGRAVAAPCPDDSWPAVPAVAAGSACSTRH